MGRLGRKDTLLKTGNAVFQADVAACPKGKLGGAIQNECVEVVLRAMLIVHAHKAIYAVGALAVYGYGIILVGQDEIPAQLVGTGVDPDFFLVL